MRSPCSAYKPAPPPVKFIVCNGISEFGLLAGLEAMSTFNRVSKMRLHFSAPLYRKKICFSLKLVYSLV